MKRRALAVPVLLLSLLVAVPGRAASSPAQVLSRTGQVVSWSGTLTTSDPLGCGEAVSLGCDHAVLKVRAARGAWITVAVDGGEGFYLRVTNDGREVASNGSQSLSTHHTPTVVPATVTFQQLRTGLVSYDVGVSTMVVAPGSPISYRVTSRLAGKAFDRQGDCFVGLAGVDHLLDADDGRRLRLSVRLVSAPADAVLVRKAAAGLVDAYDRINIGVTVSFDTMPLTGWTTYPFEVVQKRYGGLRPPGVDVVHVLTDQIAGGYADCIGGIALHERGFSVGGIHYRAGGVVPLPVDPVGLAAVISAHEIGHELGGQHQQVSCAEAVPQQALRPARDGWVGPCTLMGPLAIQTSETFSALEKSTIRAYVRAYAGA